LWSSPSSMALENDFEKLQTSMVGRLLRPRRSVRVREKPI
jgi:hypothetical protein